MNLKMQEPDLLPLTEQPWWDRPFGLTGFTNWTFLCFVLFSIFTTFCCIAFGEYLTLYFGLYFGR